MSKTGDWAIEEQEEQEVMNDLIGTHAETVEIAEKILNEFPDLVNHATLEFVFNCDAPIKEATEKAYEKLLLKICKIIQPENDEAFIIVYRYLKRNTDVRQWINKMHNLPHN